MVKSASHWSTRNSPRKSVEPASLLVASLQRVISVSHWCYAHETCVIVKPLNLRKM